MYGSSCFAVSSTEIPTTWKPRRAILLLELDETRNLNLAGAAPRRPEVEQHRPCPCTETARRPVPETSFSVKLSGAGLASAGQVSPPAAFTLARGSGLHRRVLRPPRHVVVDAVAARAATARTATAHRMRIELSFLNRPESTERRPHERGEMFDLRLRFPRNQHERPIAHRPHRRLVPEHSDGLVPAAARCAGA